MNITGIRPYESVGIYGQINNIANNNTVNTVDEIKDNSVKTNGVDLAARARQTETSYDFAKKYEPDKTYSMKGSEVDITKLDVMNTVPVSRKDEALAQYKEFVPAKAAENTGRQLENFEITF
ncbi:MAG: hypothetical protein IJK13_02415 [Lachnospiraceae bacterium]|nr:hypothetical protein [Lachnospiraceae bacterium]MBR0434843.1 hypothetical protein [Lachnospiraceae bacterium]